MVIRLPLVYQVILWLLIVTWPIIILIAAGGAPTALVPQARAKPLVKVLASRAA